MPIYAYTRLYTPAGDCWGPAGELLTAKNAYIYAYICLYTIIYAYIYVYIRLYTPLYAYIGLQGPVGDL